MPASHWLGLLYPAEKQMEGAQRKTDTLRMDRQSNEESEEKHNN